MANGRTYTIKKTVLNPYYKSEMLSYRRSLPFTARVIQCPLQYIFVETPYVVPNGKWVLERPQAGYSQVIGEDVKLIEHIVLDETTSFVLSKTLYVSDKPFGFVTWDGIQDGYRVEMKRSETLYFTSARQIHKGELGRAIPVKKLSFAAEKLIGPEEGATNGDRQRARMGWVRLADLIIAAQANPLLLMDQFLSFSLQYFVRNEYSGDFEAALHIVRAKESNAIEGKQPEIELITRAEIYRVISETPFDDIWVRHGFATTVLRLIEIGYSSKPISV